MENNKEYIVSIDIGSYGVEMSVGEKLENGTLRIYGVEFVEIEDCVKDGDISNFLTLGEAISKAKKALEKELGRQLKSAYVGISGRSAYCVRYEDYIDVKSRDMSITAEDVRELNARIDSVQAGGADEIVERIPLRYRVDDHQEVKNPIGCFGRRLSATYLLIIVSKQQIDRIGRAMFKAEIELAGMCVNPVVIAEALLSKEEREAGVAIVDIGGDLTDISIIRENKLWYFASLPIGGSAINNDLHEFLKISKTDIELKKRRYGSAIAELVPLDALVPISMPGRAKKHILKRNIAEITEARLKDIASLVLRELQATKMQRKLNGGVILTGGTAYLNDIDELFAKELGMDVRICDTIHGVDDESAAKLSCCNETAVIATMLYGAKHLACKTQTPPPSGPTNRSVPGATDNKDSNGGTLPIDEPNPPTEGDKNLDTSNGEGGTSTPNNGVGDQPKEPSGEGNGTNEREKEPQKEPQKEEKDKEKDKKEKKSRWWIVGKAKDLLDKYLNDNDEFL